MHLTEFARAIGVSPTTVSYVLSGRGRISQKTREMVLRRMGELGYVPNLNAQRLASGRSRTILIPVRTADVVRDPYLGELTEGMLETLRHHGYSAQLDLPVDGTQGEAELSRKVRSRAFAGSVLLEGYYLPDDMLQQIAGLQHPCVLTDGHGMRQVPYTTTVVYAVADGMREAARFLAGLGHRRIAVLNDIGLSCGAFVDELQELGIRTPAERVGTVAPHVGEVETETRRLLAGPERPTALFARKDMLGMAAMREARRMGLRVPEHLSVVSVDDTYLARLAEPPLTAVRLNCREMGVLLAETLLDRIAAPRAAPEVKHHPVGLVVRESTAAAMAS